MNPCTICGSPRHLATRDWLIYFFLSEKEKKIISKKSKYTFSKDSSLDNTTADALRTVTNKYFI